MKQETDSNEYEVTTRIVTICTENGQTFQRNWTGSKNQAFRHFIGKVMYCSPAEGGPREETTVNAIIY